METAAHSQVTSQAHDHQASRCDVKIGDVARVWNGQSLSIRTVTEITLTHIHGRYLDSRMVGCFTATREYWQELWQLSEAGKLRIGVQPCDITTVATSVGTPSV